MLPKSISASSLLNYSCPSRYYHENILRAETASNFAADLGSVCHQALEDYVKKDFHLDPTIKFSVLEGLYWIAYYDVFTTTEYFEEGREMLERWYNRQDWSDRDVISTESKETFEVPVTLPDGTKHMLPVTYIMDRLDVLQGGTPEVTDYKTIRERLTPEQLRHKIQARLYGVAAQMKFPQADGVWVVFDLLRYDRVGVYFSKEENRETYKILVHMAQRIIDDEPEGPDDKNWPKEVVNETCKYCIRKTSCETILKNAHSGGLAGMTLSWEAEDQLKDMVDRRARIKWAEDAVSSARSEIDEKILDFMIADGVTELQGRETLVKITGRSTTQTDSERVRNIVGDQVWLDYSGGITQAKFKKLLEDDRISDEQKSLLKGTQEKFPGKRYLKSTEQGE